MSLQGFRRLLKGVNNAFKGDFVAVNAAKLQLREEFLKNKHENDPSKLDELHRGIDEIDEMLKFHVVQGKMNDRGNFGKFYYHYEYQFS